MRKRDRYILAVMFHVLYAGICVMIRLQHGNASGEVFEKESRHNLNIIYEWAGAKELIE